MKKIQFAHCSLCIHDLPAAEIFYQDYLNLKKITRPHLPFPGAWFALGQGQALHLLAVLDAPRVATGRAPGEDTHLALFLEDFKGIQMRLRSAGFDIHQSRSGRTAFFCRDPSGNVLECLAWPE